MSEYICLTNWDLAKLLFITSMSVAYITQQLYVPQKPIKTLIKSVAMIVIGAAFFYVVHNGQVAGGG